ncbi:alanine--tRNA ligase [Acholeplasma equifetale]|uniref:alanine--tRNA ligase n=1 Tax=Acholeplasma equifetale TaxID=264634 RepID=UPI00047B6F3C|nr:alanine--tRNA ligase [Acholeplasma equifetale]
MRYMTHHEIRKTWLNFFKSKGHMIEKSSSLIPMDDPTLLWINAGVAPLKKYFDGRETPKSRRITNIQKSIRTNDIDNVGRTARHHTFFEMMGNFSIGDYFKKEAIEFAFELLTSEAYFGIPLEKLYFTYYPTDLDAKNYWLNLGVDPSHLIPLETNFWEIGPGPSGPCTEVHFDRGEAFDKRGVELIYNEVENDRYIEIWNIVFSQYNANPSKPGSEYKELPSKNIDTGAGLERFACILQNAKTNFETDLHLPIIHKVAELSNRPYDGSMPYKVISDHIKALVVAISDGAILSNEGRGYVLRRLLRRAIKYGKTLGFNEPFLYKLVDTVIEMLDEVYPDIKEKRDIIISIIKKEELKFFETIEAGIKHLLSSVNHDTLSGEDAFKLYDTYGFPIELTLEYAEENNIKVDVEGYEALLEQQREQSRKARDVKLGMNSQDEALLNFKDESIFVGYDRLQVETKVIKVFDQGIVLKETPFYATMGGQVKDEGTINGLVVKNVIKLPHGQHLHVVETNSFSEGDEVLAIVDKRVRKLTEKNHTATHLLHKAIKETLGNHSNQQGSYNGPDKLTFDINHYESITKEQILNIERIVKEKIKENIKVDTKEMPIDEAKKLGATMLFGEKYGQFVRVVNIGNWSIELCGGTHLDNTKEIDNFVITSVESIGSGIYRFEGITGDVKNILPNVLKNQLESIERLNEKIRQYNGQILEMPALTYSYQDVLNLRDHQLKLSNMLKELEKTHEQTLIQSVLQKADSFIPEQIKPLTYIYVVDLPQNSLKPLIDVLYDKMKTETVVLFNETNEKVSYLVKSGINEAKQVILSINQALNGSGGGKDNFAQGGTQQVALFREWKKGN